MSVSLAGGFVLSLALTLPCTGQAEDLLVLLELLDPPSFDVLCLCSFGLCS